METPASTSKVDCADNDIIPGPWKVLPCPQWAGKHPFHDHRYIATADAVVEFGHDKRPDQWRLSKGSLICSMRDVTPANARLVAAAPDLLEQLTQLATSYAYWLPRYGDPEAVNSQLMQNVRAAIAKAAI